MKIGVVGNCSAPAIGFSLMQLLENDTVYGFEASVWQRKGKLNEVIDLLKSCDIVFLHKLPEAYGVMEWSQFASVHSCVYALPPTLFTGFHPDCIYIPAAGGQFVGSAIGRYSSAIAAAVYSLGGDVQTAVRLFNSNAFERHLDQRLSARRSWLGLRSRALGEQNRRGWRPIPQRRMWPHFIVMTPPAFDDDPRFLERVEDLAV